MLQADVFCSARLATRTLRLVRFACALWLLTMALLTPLCELDPQQRCVWPFGPRADRADTPGEELGNLIGEGQPLPSSTSSPMDAQQRTLWLLASLGYLSTLFMLLYFVWLLVLSFKHKLLFAQCTSYDYDSLTCSSDTSTSALPLTGGMKAAAVLFQLLVPTTLGVALMYFALILPFRTPLSWPLAIAVHAGTALAALAELLCSRFIFRCKALLYWLLLCLAYLIALLVLNNSTDLWEYAALDWDGQRGLGLAKAIMAWIFGPLCIGPACFFLCAGVQYLRDGRQRGVLTDPRTIGSRLAARRTAHAHLLRSDYITGELASYAAATGAVHVHEAGLPTSASAADLLPPVLSTRSSFQPSHSRTHTPNGGFVAAGGGVYVPSTFGNGGRPPPQLDWPSDHQLLGSSPPPASSSSYRPRDGPLNISSDSFYHAMPNSNSANQLHDDAPPSQQQPGYLRATVGWLKSWVA
jgi:hypothetical protein